MANGTAYGFLSIADLFAQRVNQAGPERVYDAIVQSAAEYTRVLNNLLADWVDPVTAAQEQFELPGSGTLQPLDADGNPLPVLPSGSYQVAFPIQGAGTAWGTNRIVRAHMTVAEANRLTLDALQRDKDWMIRHILAAIFTNVTWTYRDDIGPNGSKGLGNITIQPLANGDTVLFGRRNLAVPATDTHFLGQAAAIADATNPYPTIYTELSEHPSNAGRRIIAYIASDLVATTQALASFVDVNDPDINVASGVATLNNIPDVGVGDRVLGKTDNVWVVEWSAIPSGYIVAKAEGIAPVGMRQYEVPELQGFFPEAFNVDGNHLVNRMLRFAGFGIRNRVAAVAMEIADATYDVPTGYLAPLPV